MLCAVEKMQEAPSLVVVVPTYTLEMTEFTGTFEMVVAAEWNIHTPKRRNFKTSTICPDGYAFEAAKLMFRNDIDIRYSAIVKILIPLLASLLTGRQLDFEGDIDMKAFGAFCELSSDPQVQERLNVLFDRLRSFVRFVVDEEMDSVELMTMFDKYSTQKSKKLKVHFVTMPSSWFFCAFKFKNVQYYDLNDEPLGRLK